MVSGYASACRVAAHPAAAAGIYHGNLDYESNSDDLVDGAQLLPYPVIPSSPSLSPTRQNVPNTITPMSMALTEFHFLLLYRDRVMGISNLNEQLAYEELLPLVRIYTPGTLVVTNGIV